MTANDLADIILDTALAAEIARIEAVGTPHPANAEPWARNTRLLADLDHLRHAYAILTARGALTELRDLKAATL